MFTKKIMGLILMATITVLWNHSIKAQEATVELPTRDEIEVKYKWNLTDIYPDDRQWEKDFKWLENAIQEYKKYEGRLGESANTLKECLILDEKAGTKLSQAYNYASMSKDLDLNNVTYQGMYDRISTLASNLAAASAFIRPEILNIPEEKLWSFVESDSYLKTYKHYFENILRMKPHTLSKEEEKLLALASPVEEVPYSAFGFFSDADIQFPVVKDAEGNDVKISHGRYYAALESTDRGYRERVYKGFYKPFMEYKNTLSALFTGNIKALIFNAKARRYQSTREAALTPNNIPVAVYDNLINTVDQNLEPIHKWANLKKKILNLEEFHPYDSYVTLFPGVRKKYSFEEGKALILEALKPLGEDYIKNLKSAFENRWIDVYETRGKRSGAYSSGTIIGVHPYVLLNWNNTLDDVFTLAHEMGHNMHSYYTEKNQPYPYADYSIFIAEVASTMNEALLLDYMIEHAQSKEEKMALIEKNLNSITTTFYRQTNFAEMEKTVNDMMEKGEPLTPDKLCKLNGDLYQKYWGPAMTVDKEETYSWSRIPHYYYNFYVYQYATSFAASQALAEKIKKEGQPAIDKYLAFLKAGNSKYPIDVLIDAGVDMKTPAPILAVVHKMNYLLDELGQLLNEK